MLEREGKAREWQRGKRGGDCGSLAKEISYPSHIKWF